MLNRFPEYSQPDEQELRQMWEQDAVFVFDASALLNLYRYKRETSDALLRAMATLATGGRLWIPDQAAREFAKNRTTVLEGRDSAEIDFISQQLKEVKTVANKIGNRPQRSHYEGARYTSILEEAQSALQKQLAEDRAATADFIAELVKHDTILEELTKIVAGHIGDPYDESKIIEVYKEAEYRYALKIPPGYEDGQKPDYSAFGDYVFWREIIDFAAQQGRSVIVITDDDKGDWWSSDKTPRPELRREFRARVGKPFWAYRSPRFLEWANKYLALAASSEEIEDATVVVSASDTDGVIQRLNEEMPPFRLKPERDLPSGWETNPKVLKDRVKEIDDAILAVKRRNEELENLMEEFADRNQFPAAWGCLAALNSNTAQLDALIVDRDNLAMKLADLSE